MKTQVDCITTTVILTVLVLLLGVAVDGYYRVPATQPKVTVGAVVTVIADLEELTQGEADNVSVNWGVPMFNKTEALVTINQDLYLKTTYERYFMVDTVSTDVYERLHSINTISSRIVNHSREDALDEIKNSVKPLTDQLFYNENHRNEIDLSTNGGSLWLARLLVDHPTTGYTPLDLPVTGVYVMIRHLVNCKHMPLKCAEYIHSDKEGMY